jgi:hypothetical protein
MNPVQEHDLTSENKIPSVTLTAIGNNTPIDLQAIGKPTVLIFCTRETAGISEDICHKIDSKYQLISEVFVASVVNLEVVPWPFRFIAESAMRNVYHDLIARLPERLTDKDYIYILPDWDGSVTKAVDMPGVNRTAGIVVLDAAGTIVGTYQGDNPEEALLELLEQAV